MGASLSQPTNSDSNSAKDEKPEKVSQEAIKVLTRVPDVTADTLRGFLYSARVLKEEETACKYICEYIQNGQCHGYGIQVVNIVRVVRDGVKDFDHIEKLKDKFRMLLWHGTKKNKISSILQNGFKLPNSTGQMFGQGIYFADRISKSANYCDQGSNPMPGSTAFLLLCDVLLGKSYNKKNPDHTMTKTPQGQYGSVMCTGKFIPDRGGNKKILKSILPCGKTVPCTNFPNCTVQYNEFIVYDPDMVRVKYLVEVKFSSKPM